MPPGHPIILLKSNLFKMAAVSVKRSILASQITVRTSENPPKSKLCAFLLPTNVKGLELNRQPYLTCVLILPCVVASLIYGHLMGLIRTDLYSL